MLLQRINSIISRVKQRNEIERNYVCINCGSPVKELVKKYSSTVKINHCVNKTGALFSGEDFLKFSIFSGLL